MWIWLEASDRGWDAINCSWVSFYAEMGQLGLLRLRAHPHNADIYVLSRDLRGGSGGSGGNLRTYPHVRFLALGGVHNCASSCWWLFLALPNIPSILEALPCSTNCCHKETEFQFRKCHRPSPSTLFHNPTALPCTFTQQNSQVG